ncbi:MAG: YybH family protein, partial [Bacteroidota bacterium]
AMAYYADDAIQMPPNAPPNKGKEAIRAWISQMMQSGMKITAAKFTSTEVDAGGKVAYEVGDYDMTMTIPEMGEMKDNGKYVAVWKQQQDGSWKVHAEIWNTNVPMQMPAVEKPAEKK